MKAAYVVSFVYRHSNIRLDFMFGAHKNADALYCKGTAAMSAKGNFHAEDDFECRAYIDMTEIAGIAFNNVEIDTKKNVEMRIEGDKLYSTAVQAEQRKPNLATPANALRI